MKNMETKENKIIVSIELDNYDQAKKLTEYGMWLKNRGEKHESKYQSEFRTRHSIHRR